MGDFILSLELGTSSKMEPAPGISQESSISFGRFAADSLSWEKWSSFSQNRYLEEVERFSIPGSVIQKKAYFEAHFKKIAAQRALLQQAESDSNLGNKSNIFNESHHTEDMTGLMVRAEQNEELTGASDLLDFECAPCESDIKEEIFNMIDPNKVMSMEGKEEEKTREHSPSMKNIVQEEEMPGEVLSSSNKMIEENVERDGTSERNAQEEALDLSEVDKEDSFEQEQEVQLEEEHSTKKVEIVDGGMEDAEEKVTASKHAKADPKKPNEKKKPIPKKTDASSGRKVVRPYNNKMETLEKGPSNAISRTLKVQVSSRPGPSAKALPRHTVKMENDVVLRSKMAGGYATESRISPPISLPRSVSPGGSNSTFTVSQPFGLATNNRSSTAENLGSKMEASKSSQNILSLPETQKMEVSANGATKAAGLKVTHQQNRNQHKKYEGEERKQMENKRAKSKRRQDESHPTSAGSHQPNIGSKLDPKVGGVAFSFESDKRAEKRKEFYMRLEEKLSAKEAEMNQIQARTQEELEAEIKLFRRSLNFKATPLPTFYQESAPPKTEMKKILSVCAKLPKLGRKDGSLITSHRTVSEKEIKHSSLVEKCIGLQDKNGKLPLASERTTYLKKVQEVGSANHSTENHLKSKVPRNRNIKEVTCTAETGNFSTESAYDELEGKKCNVMEHPFQAEESSRKSANGETQVLHSDSLLAAEHWDLTNDVFAESSEDPNKSSRNVQVGEAANSEMTKDKGESEMIGNTEEKIGSADDKVTAQKSNGAKVKDYNLGTIGNGSRLKAKAQQHPSLNGSQESKNKIVKAAKRDRQKAATSDNVKREAATNASMNHAIKGSSGLACLIADLAVAS